MSNKKKAAKKQRADRRKDKASIKARTSRAALIGSTAATSPLWKANPALQDSGNKVVAAGTKLDDDESKVTSLEAQLVAARTVRDDDVVAYDAVYATYVTGAESVSSSAQDLEGLALDVLVGGTYGLASPLDVTAKFDATGSMVDVYVKCAPGMHRCVIEISPDPTMATGIKAFPGDGARQSMGGFAPGTYWVHAAHVRASQRSGYTGPIAVIVK